MLRKAGQTAGPIGLKFFVDTHGGRGCYRATPGPSASLKLNQIKSIVVNEIETD